MIRKNKYVEGRNAEREQCQARRYEDKKEKIWPGSTDGREDKKKSDAEEKLCPVANSESADATRARACFGCGVS
jgi:hypothetical protein